MKDFFKNFIFCLLAAVIGFICGSVSSNNPFAGFGLCVVFVFILSYSYASAVKMYNWLELPNISDNIEIEESQEDFIEELDLEEVQNLD